MKLLLKLFFLIVLLGIFSCKENKTVITESKEIQELDSSKIDLSQENSYDKFDEEREMLIKEAKEKIKSLIKENQKVTNYNYERKSKVGTPNDLYIKIDAGNLFTETDIHAVLSISFYDIICVYYYDLKSDSLQTVLYDEYGLIYQDNSIKDVNGDNKKDFIVECYPTTGCCLSHLRYVYLFQDKTKFTEKYEFMNPTFYPKEKIIRGLKYGWNAPLYKYKWNGLKVDTLEYIYNSLEDTTTNRYFKTKKWLGEATDYKLIEERIKINSIPKEYYSIDNFDVFNRR